MSQPEWDALVEEVRDLQVRVARMEAAMGTAGAATAIAAPPPAASPQARGILESPTSLLPVLGRALLGLAGAYLLRALTEAGTFTPRMGVAIGLVYAMLWLVWAARTPAGRRLETALHGLTSVLVLSSAALRGHCAVPCHLDLDRRGRCCWRLPCSASPFPGARTC